jgi:predicted Zn-dependent protease
VQALPGGHIFITRALLRKLKNEAQLAGDTHSHLFLRPLSAFLFFCAVPQLPVTRVAGVLGHEVGHVVHRFQV